MVFEEFRDSLKADLPSEGSSLLLTALWWDAKGGWAKAHAIAQELESPDAAWVHAYLHRKEGDTGNASYWYHRAGKPQSKDTPQTEWNQIVRDLLQD